MTARVDKLEGEVVEIRERLTRIETRLDQTATKEDLARLEAQVSRVESTLVKWLVGLFVGFTTLNIVVMTFVLNYAAPPYGRFAKTVDATAPATVAVPQPMVIVIPPGAVQWQAQPPK